MELKIHKYKSITNVQFVDITMYRMFRKMIVIFFICDFLFSADKVVYLVRLNIET